METKDNFNVEMDCDWDDEKFPEHKFSVNEEKNWDKMLHQLCCFIMNDDFVISMLLVHLRLTMMVLEV